MRNDSNYGISRWGEGYFAVSEVGHVTVRPRRSEAEGDLFLLMRSLVEQGIEPPILIRFNEIITDKIESIHKAFALAIEEFQYRSKHRIVFPIKVNPLRHVVENVLIAGKAHHMGLEVGSKPELMAVLALDQDPESVLICNGYKDVEYITLALMASKLGRQTLIIIEQEYELKLVLDLADSLDVEAKLGFRMKLGSTGTGRWKTSGGENSKFGLFSHEIVNCIDKLKECSREHTVKLLHFHMGSQVTTIESIKRALKEGSRMYTQLAALLPSLCYFDVGGGLAVDYDGTRSGSESSMNYSLEEYARDVVSEIGEACLEGGVEDPIIITESGRAIVSHHCVLILEIIDVTAKPTTFTRNEALHKHDIILALLSMLDEISPDNCREAFHDLIEIKEGILEEFIYGRMSLEERAYAEKIVYVLLHKLHALYKMLPDIHQEELSLQKKILSETYFCNFSVFQSLPDSWAIGQIFPIMPIHRLNEPTTHQAILADLSCDSDGKIDTFIDKYGRTHYLHLHGYHNEPYYIGIFLVGAYQEILGGLHNLFGDTNVVHAELLSNGEWKLSRLVEGDTIKEVLHYVEYNSENMMTQLQELLDQAIKTGRITLTESAQIKKKFKYSLDNYTYLVVG